MRQASNPSLNRALNRAVLSGTGMQRPVSPRTIASAQQGFAQGALGLYVLPFLPPQLAAGASGVDVTLQLDKDFDFLFDRIVATFFNDFSVYFQDSSRGLPWMESFANPILAQNLSGFGTLPYWLARPMRIPKGTRITATFANTIGVAQTVQIALVGRKV